MHIEFFLPLFRWNICLGEGVLSVPGRSVFLITLFLGLMFSACALAQDSEETLNTDWVALNVQTVNAFDAGNYSLALQMAQAAQDLAKGRYGESSPQYLTSSANLAAIYVATSRYKEAETVFSWLLPAEKNSNPSSVLGTLNTFAALYVKTERFDDAERMLMEIVDQNRLQYGDSSPDTLSSQINLAAVYEKRHKFRESEKLLEEVLDAAPSAGREKDRFLAEALNNMSTVYREEGRFAEAENILSALIEFNKNRKPINGANLATNLINIGDVYNEEGKYVLAAQAFSEASAISVKVFGPNAYESLAVQIGLGNTYRAEGDYANAEFVFSDVLHQSQARYGTRDSLSLTAADGLAEVRRDEGRYDEAMSLFRGCGAEEVKAGGDYSDEALNCQNGLAGTLEDLGRYGEAEKIFRDILDIRMKKYGPKKIDTIISMNNLARLYHLLKLYDKALPIFLEARKSIQLSYDADNPHALTISNNLGLLYQETGHYPEARALLEEVWRLSDARWGSDNPATVKTLVNLAGLDQAQGDYPSAERRFRDALKVSENSSNSRSRETLTCLNNLANLYIRMGQYPLSSELHKSALSLSKELFGERNPTTLTIQLNIISLMVRQEKYDQAEVVLRQMKPALLAWLKQELVSTADDSAKRQIVLSQSNIQNVILSLATMPKSGREIRRLAGEVILHFKHLQGEEEAYLAHLSRVSSDPRLRELAEQINALRLKLSIASRGDSEAFEDTFSKLEVKKSALAELSQGYDKHLRSEASDLNSVRSALPDGAVLIEFRQYQPVDFETQAFGEPRFAALILSPAEEPDLVDLGPVSHVRRVKQGLGDKEAADLYKEIFLPIEDRISRANSVYIAPDDILNLVPFAQLRLPDGRYWVERQEIHLLQSARDLLRAGSGQFAQGLLALGGIRYDLPPAFATHSAEDHPSQVDQLDLRAAVDRAGTYRLDYLPGTDQEVSEIARLYHRYRGDEGVEIWRAGEADKARLLGISSPPRVLHLATHGIYFPSEDGLFRAKEPMLSAAVALAGANADESSGYLFALEAQSLNLEGTELVVLSACDTAKGDLDYSEGVYGLARAFKIAGARNVLVTLWRLDDLDARDFMSLFYEYWLTGKSTPATALRQAQLSFISRSGKQREPSSWAAYALFE